MSTYRNTHVTPSVRAANLLKTALASSPESNAPHTTAVISEAHALIAGEEPYLEKHTSDLLVPQSHLDGMGLSDAEVRGAWTSLLNATGDTDWAQLYADGKTQDRLGSAMCSGAYEAVVLQNFALMAKPARVLEIGVFTGTATLALALLPTVKQIVALDVEPYLKGFCEPFWASAGVSDKIDFKIALALETLATMSKSGCEPFDLVFIDADKPSYRAYVQALLDLGLLSEDGVILAVRCSSLVALAVA